MRRTVIILSLLAAVCGEGLAQDIIDITSCRDTIIHLDYITEKVDTIALNKQGIDIRSIPNANLLVNDSLLMLGTMDGVVYRIKDGSLVRRMNESPFNLAQMTGEPAVHPGSALLDGSGRFCYAWGNAILEGRRINFIKKMDFSTGETLDSISVNSADFALSKDDSLRMATGHDYLTCFPEYKFILPENGRIARIRYYGGSKMWIKLFRKGKIEDYICNTDGTELGRVERIVYQGRDIEPPSMIGFAKNKLVSVVSTETDFIIIIYHLKHETYE